MEKIIKKGYECIDDETVMTQFRKAYEQLNDKENPISPEDYDTRVTNILCAAIYHNGEDAVQLWDNGRVYVNDIGIMCGVEFEITPDGKYHCLAIS